MAENIILQSTNNELTLTDKRVIFDAKGGGKSEYMSIPLDQIAHSGLKTSEKTCSCWFVRFWLRR